MYPALHQHARATNIFWDGSDSEKHLSDLASAGYSPAKKKGERHTRGVGISPRDADAFEVYPSDKDNDDNVDYSPTPTYKAS